MAHMATLKRIRKEIANDGEQRAQQQRVLENKKTVLVARIAEAKSEGDYALAFDLTNQLNDLGADDANN